MSFRWGLPLVPVNIQLEDMWTLIVTKMVIILVSQNRELHYTHWIINCLYINLVKYIRKTAEGAIR